MGQAKLYGQKSSGTTINGIIKDYYVYAGNNVNAGDLVEYINGIGGITYQTNSETNTTYATYSDASACTIDEETVLIAISNGSTNGNLIVAKINGATINLGTPLQVRGSSTAFEGALKVDTNRAVVFWKTGGNSGHSMYIVKINGTTPTATSISIGGSRGLDMNSDSYCLLKTNKIMCTYNKDNRYSTWYMQVINITSDTTADFGTAVSGYTSHLALYSTDRVFCAYNDNYFIASIDGTTITTSNTASTGVNIINCIQLTSRTILMSLYENTTYGCCVYKDETLSSIEYLSETQRLRLTKLNSDTAFGVDYDSSKYRIIEVSSDMSITLGTTYNLENSDTFEEAHGITALNNATIFGIYKDHSNSTYNFRLFGINNLTVSSSIATKMYETQVRKTTSNQFDGVAKTSGTGGTTSSHNQQVSIYTLDPTIL